MLIRRGYRGGLIFDIVVGIDLLNNTSEDKFVQYLERRKPKILLISTPCTGMKGARDK